MSFKELIFEHHGVVFCNISADILNDIFVLSFEILLQF